MSNMRSVMLAHQQQTVLASAGCGLIMMAVLHRDRCLTDQLADQWLTVPTHLVWQIDRIKFFYTPVQSLLLFFGSRSAASS